MKTGMFGSSFFYYPHQLLYLIFINLNNFSVFYFPSFVCLFCAMCCASFYKELQKLMPRCNVFVMFGLSDYIIQGSDDGKEWSLSFFLWYYKVVFWCEWGTSEAPLRYLWGTSEASWGIRISGVVLFVNNIKWLFTVDEDWHRVCILTPFSS